MQDPEASRTEPDTVALLLVVLLEPAEERPLGPAGVAQVLSHMLKGNL